MQKRTIEKGICQICKKEKITSELVPSYMIRESILTVIRKENPDWSMDGYICFSDLNNYWSDHISEILEIEKGELSELEKEVVGSIEEQEILSEDMYEEYDSKISLGGRVADRVAAFGGSWKFISIFGLVILCWIMGNTFMVFRFKPFDPYPYILLNLLLSCIAAIQAPIIMMSQNRQETKDRLRSGHDYQVNLKAELEIRHLNDKIDFLINHQWKNLLEVQQMQIEMLNEITSRKRIE